MRKLVSFAAAAAVVIAASASFTSADDAEDQVTIKQVMKEAHKDGLLKKVLSGKASEDDKKKLAELYAALASNTPPKGDEADWKERCAALSAAAKQVAAGDKKGIIALKKATTCATCHKAHKGK